MTFRFRTLGPVDLTGSDGRTVVSVLSQPKRTALLAYLAASRPGRLVRRDTLLGVFWADREESRARNALSQALHYLRRSLGPDVIVSRGDEEVGVDPDRLTCDAVEFQRLLEEGREEEAVELYRGDFLEGLHLDTVASSRWAENERRSLREAMVRALREVARRAVESGEVETAVASLRRAIELDPYAAAPALELVEVYTSQGERAAALDVAVSHRDRMSAELEVEPSAELEGLIEELRSDAAPDPAAAATIDAIQEGPRGAAPRASAGALEPERASRPAGAERTSPPAEPERSSRPAERVGRRVAWALGGLVLLLAASAWWWYAGNPDASSVPAPDRAAVFPLSFRGSGELAYLGEGGARLLGSRLDAGTPLSAVDPYRLEETLAEEPGAVSPRRGAALAPRLGAGLFVLGDIVEIRDRLRIQVTLYRVEGDSAVALGRVVEEGSAADAFLLLDRVAEGLAQAWSEAATAADSPVSLLPDKSGLRRTAYLPTVAMKAHLTRVVR